MRGGVLCLLRDTVGLRCDLRIFTELVLRFAHGAHDVALEGHRDEGERITEQAKARILGCHMKGTESSNSQAILRTTRSVIGRYLPSAGLDSAIDGVTHADADTGV